MKNRFAAVLAICGLAISAPSWASPVHIGNTIQIGQKHLVSANGSPAAALNANSVALLSNGNYVIAWNAGPTVDDFRIFNSAGAPVSAIITTGTTSTYAPSVASLSNGKFAIESEVAGQVNLQIFKSNGVAQTAVIPVGVGHLGSMASAGNNGVVVTWSNGDEFAKFFSGNGTAQTGALDLGIVGWRGNVTSLSKRLFVAAIGTSDVAQVFGQAGPIGASIPMGLSGADLFGRPISPNTILIGTAGAGNVCTIYNTQTATLTPLTISTDVNTNPELLILAGTQEVLAFYNKTSGGVQPYTTVFNKGKLYEAEHPLTAILDAYTAPNNFGIIVRQADAGHLIFTWVDSSGALWTGIATL